MHPKRSTNPKMPQGPLPHNLSQDSILKPRLTSRAHPSLRTLVIALYSKIPGPSERREIPHIPQGPAHIRNLDSLIVGPVGLGIRVQGCVHQSLGDAVGTGVVVALADVDLADVASEVSAACEMGKDGGVEGAYADYTVVSVSRDDV